MLSPARGRNRTIRNIFRRFAVAAALAGLLPGLAMPTAASGAEPAAPSSPAAATARSFAPEALPTDHPAWDDIDWIWTRTGFAGLPVFTGPLARVDIAEALLDLLAERPEIAGKAPVIRLRRELARELRALGDDDAPASTPPPLEFLEGGARFVVQGEARLAATVTDDTGDIPSGTRAGVVLRGELPGRLFVLADLGVEKILDTNPLGDSIVKNSPWYLSTNETHLAWRTDALDLTFGLLENRWGPGSSGTLLLSDDALAVPGILLGRTFGSRLRVVAVTAALHHPEQRWFSAHRAELRLGRVTLGLHEAAAYSSSGFDPYYVVGLIPYTLVQRLQDRTTSPGGNVTDHRNNVLVGADLAWRIADGWRADGEFLIDDLATESASQPDRLGYQAGLSWAGDAFGSSARARAEFAKVYRYTYSVFYGANLIHDETPLGYGRGPDVEHAELFGDRDFGPDLALGLGWDWNRRGESPVGEFWDPADDQSRDAASKLSGVVETRSFPHVRVGVTWRDLVTAKAKVGVLDVRNRDHEDGTDEVSAHGRFELRAQW
jgi:hypothetical protein